MLIILDDIIVFVFATLNVLGSEGSDIHQGHRCRRQGGRQVLPQLRVSPYVSVQSARPFVLVFSHSGALWANDISHGPPVQTLMVMLTWRG